MSELRQRVPIAAPTDTPTLDEPSDIPPAVPAGTIQKLLVFIVALVTLPLGTYFVTKDAVFGGSGSLAGGTAALVANAVLMAYIVVAVKDDRAEEEAKKRDEDAKNK